MKIAILYKFRDNSWGGANQFLKGLRNYFRKKGCYAEDAESADVLLFISYPFNNEVLYKKIKKIKKNKNIIVINRMNGPIHLYRNKDIEIDKINFAFNKSVADGTVFQTQWSRKKCFEAGLEPNKQETIIMNAPDPEFFYPLEVTKKVNHNKRINLIATSWSNNPSKGFDIYKYLDEYLDFTRYKMTFIGRSLVKFKNIQHKPVLPSKELAEQLRLSDIFIFASKLETCSNSLLEALHCGLPVVARNNSSQPEVLGGKSGILFEGKEDVIAAIDAVVDNLEYFRKLIDVPDIIQIGNSYYDFCNKIYSAVQEGKYNTKQWGTFDYLKLISKVYVCKFGSRVKYKMAKITEVIQRRKNGLDF
ncbi:MAG: glycosyltransferase family 4 protein [Candidatus Omnitrophica bacterium]|nr:glycosyltransferase family 4 protein [Candidatus Omnitrophota bacterium]